MDDRHKTSFDRIWRLVALFVLCALVYYFSFENGRQTGKAKAERLTAETESLRLQLTLQSEELDELRAALKALTENPPPQKERESSPLSNAGEAAVAANPPRDASPKQSTGDAGLSLAYETQIPENPATPDKTIQPDNPPEELKSPEPPSPKVNPPSQNDPLPDAPSPEVSRIQLRNEENKLILNNKVLLSVLEIDLIDKTVAVRVHQLDTEARETRTMGIGESFNIRRGDTGVRLILDQLKGSLAVFIMITYDYSGEK
jgi:hypothetical protein